MTTDWGADDKIVGEFYPDGEHKSRGTVFQKVAKFNPDGNVYILKDTTTQAGNHKAAHNLTPTLVDRLYFQHQLGRGIQADKRINAAERMQEDWDKAGLEPNVCGSMEPTDGGGGNEGIANGIQTDDQLKARARWGDAVEAIGLRYGNDVIMAVHWDQMPNSLDGLLAGLDRLAEHYGV